MLIIQEVLVSDDVVENKFHCNLDACKGACCWEGDFGAPLDKEEVETLKKIYPIIKNSLPSNAQELIGLQGTSVYYDEMESMGTPLMPGGACAYLTYSNEGIALCSIEAAYNEGLIDFKKPVSCHLYPLRVKTDKHTDFVALNYDKWDICAAACELGAKKQLPVYQFVKEGIVRKFGVDFYEELDAAARHLQSNKL